jgi:proteasome lid subunit RPN8/RPN11
MKLQKHIMEKIFDHALREYPWECCGIVTGKGSLQRIHTCKNIQNKLHSEDPLRYPRDARTAYVIKRGEFDAVLSSAKEKGEEVLVLYHSHCEHEAYFSEEDVEAQTVFDEPELPDAVQMVVSVMDGEIHDVRCFQWDRILKNFRRIEDCP